MPATPQTAAVPPPGTPGPAAPYKDADARVARCLDGSQNCNSGVQRIRDYRLGGGRKRAGGGALVPPRGTMALSAAVVLPAAGVLRAAAPSAGLCAAPRRLRPRADGLQLPLPRRAPLPSCGAQGRAPRLQLPLLQLVAVALSRQLSRERGGGSGRGGRRATSCPAWWCAIFQAPSSRTNRLLAISVPPPSSSSQMTSAASPCMKTRSS